MELAKCTVRLNARAFSEVNHNDITPAEALYFIRVGHEVTNVVVTGETDRGSAQEIERLALKYSPQRVYGDQNQGIAPIFQQGYPVPDTFAALGIAAKRSEPAQELAEA